MRTCDPDIVSALATLFARYELRLQQLDDGAAILGSYWGAPEAGLIRDTVYVRRDTPLHSALHEAAHVICMDRARRDSLHTDAGGEYSEEDAVCYLQIVLASQLGIAAEAICQDMDEWGYTFRLGSAHAWFTQDADDARAWLLQHAILAPGDTLTWRRREK